MRVACSQAWLPQRTCDVSALQPGQVQTSGTGGTAAAGPPEHTHNQDAGTGPASAAAGVSDEQAGVSAASGSAVPACEPVCKPADTVLPGWAQCRPSGEGDRLAGSRAATAALPAAPPQAVQANHNAVQQTTTAFRLPQESPRLGPGVQLRLTAEATSAAQQEPPGLPADLQLRLAAEDTPAAQRLPPVAHLSDDAAPIHSRTRAHFNLQHVTLDDLEKALPLLPPEQPWQPELAPQQQDDIFYQSFLQVRQAKLCRAPFLLAVLILCALLGMPAFRLPGSTGITLLCLLAIPGCIRWPAEHLVLGSPDSTQCPSPRHSSKDCKHLPCCRLAEKICLQSSCAIAVLTGSSSHYKLWKNESPACRLCPACMEFSELLPGPPPTALFWTAAGSAGCGPA